MPIDYSEYHPKWRLISHLIRKVRAGNCCEWCGASNGSLVYRSRPTKLAPDAFKIVKIVLTVAHLDRNKDNNKFSNLAALCQKCHLNYDRNQHVENRKYGRKWKKNQLKLNL